MTMDECEFIASQAERQATDKLANEFSRRRATLHLSPTNLDEPRQYRQLSRAVKTSVHSGDAKEFEVANAPRDGIVKEELFLHHRIIVRHVLAQRFSIKK